MSELAKVFGSPVSSRFLAVNVVACALAPALARPWLEPPAVVPATRRARVLFALRLLPAAASLLTYFALFVPAHLAHEPRGGDETVGLPLLALAMLAGLVLVSAALRGLWTRNGTRRLARAWAEDAEPVWISPSPSSHFAGSRILSPWSRYLAAVTPACCVCTPGPLQPRANFPTGGHAKEHSRHTSPPATTSGTGSCVPAPTSSPGRPPADASITRGGRPRRKLPTSVPRAGGPGGTRPGRSAPPGRSTGAALVCPAPLPDLALRPGDDSRAASGGWPVLRRRGRTPPREVPLLAGFLLLAALPFYPAALRVVRALTESLLALLS